MIDRVCGIRDEHRGEDLLHVRDLTDSADDDGAWAQDLLAVGVLLRHGERVLTRGDIDAERDCEVRSSLYRVVETSIFALIAAGPHPVGTEGNTLEAVGKGRKDNVRQCLSDGELATSYGVYQCCYGSVTDRGSDTSTATEVDSHSTAVAQGQLDLTLTLLASYTARDGAVDLVRQPVLTSDPLLLQHLIEVMLKAGSVIAEGGISLVDMLVDHVGLGRRAEHIRQRQVNGLITTGLFEGQVHIVRGATDDVHRSALTLGDTGDALYGVALDQKAHTLLALVADDFLRRKGLITDGEGAEVEVSTRRLDEFGEAVQVSPCPVVVDGDDRIVFTLRECADDVLDTLLHLGVGALYGVELNSAGILPRIHRADGTTTHTDAVVVTTEQDDLFARLGSALLCIAAAGVADTTSEHDDLVEAVGRFASLAFVLEGQHRATDEWLTELIPEVARTIGCLREDLTGRLVEPRAGSAVLLPRAIGCRAGVARHVDGRPSQRHAGTTTSHTVTDLTTGTGSSAVEGLDGRGEVVRLSLEAQHAVDGLTDEEVGLIPRGGSELLKVAGAVDEGHIVLISRD